ncbi:MAG: hypothetical protein EU540_09180 [Promethearchaeota archaeon]|nr:MAG: hypothetical protein EU540_09180 [Candidatus Lokiarchaeota archaeon]
MFEIDEKGRVLCKNHSNYDYLIRPRDYFQDLYLDAELTCKTCSHYENNECYFSKTRIDEIINKGLKKTYLCRLCGKRIDRMLSIIHKLYYKEIYDVEMPLICCDCYEKIKTNEFLTYSKKMTDFYLLNIVISIFFLCYFAFFLLIFDLEPTSYYILIIVICFIVSVVFRKCIKKLRHFYFGIKYYKKHFPNQKSKE